MEEYLDILWENIVRLTMRSVDLADAILEPLHIFGPIYVIFFLAVVTVIFCQVFSRIYTTKRYEELKKEFQYWHDIRQEALLCEDKEKGRLLAKNIDQARLNKVYYDYFFEGLLKNILTVYLPVLIVGAYVNEAYKPGNLLSRFGIKELLVIPRPGGEQLVIGALFLYIIMLVAVYLLWRMAKSAFALKGKIKRRQKAAAG